MSAGKRGLSRDGALSGSGGGGESIVFHDVWKRFARGVYHDTLRDLVTGAMRRFVRGEDDGGRNEEFWALRDVSFEVEPGEVLGVIGPNGAGKSTLLKVACGILRPDRGRVDVPGRVGALVELMAGFHPELTGRENVYLQGAIMGMKRNVVSRKFSDIVEFSGVSEFIDTPVKRYSSGMKVRLGFSIAAHMEPDALLIDEVLTVGDREFRRKAIERLRAIVRREIPVIIVSHQLDRVMALCDRALLLSEGRVVAMGSASECVDAYVAGAHHTLSDGGPPPATILEVSEPSPERVRSGDPVHIRLRGRLENGDAGDRVCVGLRVRELPGHEVVFASNNVACGVPLSGPGPFEIDVELRANVGAGHYRVQGVVWDLETGLERYRGPSTLLEVDESDRVYGRVNMVPRMRRVDR